MIRRLLEALKGREPLELRLFSQVIALETALAFSTMTHRDDLANALARAELAEQKARINYDSAMALRAALGEWVDRAQKAERDLAIMRTNYEARVAGHEATEAKLRQVEAKLAAEILARRAAT